MIASLLKLHEEPINVVTIKITQINKETYIPKPI